LIQVDPPVNASAIHFIEDNGIPVGFTIYFQYALSVRATYDLECHNCGDETELNGLSFVVTNIVNIPKSFTGFQALQNGTYPTIPGVDVVAMAAEIYTEFKESQEAAEMVENIVSTLSTVGTDVTCQFSDYHGRASLNPVFPRQIKAMKRGISGGDVAFSNTDVRVSTKAAVAVPEFFPLVDKLTHAFYILDFFNDTGSFATPAGLCPFKTEWLQIDSARCLCSTEHVEENTCKSIAEHSDKSDFATAVCQPIVCSPVSDPDPVLRFYSDQPFGDFDDGVAVQFKEKVFEVLHAHANVTDVTVITIGPWMTDIPHTYIDVQYHVAGGGADPVIDPHVDGLPPGEVVNDSSTDPMSNHTIDSLQDPDARSVVRNAIPADFMVSNIKIFATARDASKDDPSFIGQFKVVNGKLSGGFIALIVICILVLLLIVAFVGLMIRRRIDPVLTRDSITFIDDVDANPYMYYDNK